MSTAIAPNPGSGTWGPLVEAVISAPLALSTKKRYARKLRVFLAWWDLSGREPFSAALIEKYIGALHAEKYPAFDINHSLVAIKRLARAAALRGWVDISLLEHIRMVEGPRVHATRIRQWLSEPQAEALMEVIDRETLTGKRDTVLIGFLLYCGLRREEAATASFEHIRIVDGQPCLVNLVCKDRKPLTKPMPRWLFTAIQAWVDAAGLTEGYILRALIGWDPRVRSEERMGNSSINMIVRSYGVKIGMPNITPHDLRRTFGRVARKKGFDLDQIQQSYGHAHLSTTQHYIGGTMDFENPPCNALPPPKGL